MSYTIEEKNLERQHLLAEYLNPLTLNALENISLQKGAKILDLGCGIGETTLMLSNRFPQAHITGLDEDEALIEVAKSRKYEKASSIQFVTGNALQMQFADNSFNFVFTRALLHHIPASITVLQEMKRVCVIGAIVFAQEPDMNFRQTYPENWAYPKLVEFANKLCADACIGRKLVHYFRSLQFQKIANSAQVVLSDGSSNLKKFFTQTAEAMGGALLRNKLTDEKQFVELINECRRIEHDEDAIVLTSPIIAVWGTKV